MRNRSPFFKSRLPILVTLLLAAAPSFAAPPKKGAAEKRPAPAAWVNSPKLMIWFDAASGGPGTTAELWYTADEMQTWQRSGKATSQNPLNFDAPDDGLYGFFIILRNEAGVSSPPPKPGSKPQQWIGVDRTLPMVQILRIQADPHFDLNREVQIRWRSRDDHLAPRPVAIHYRSGDLKVYQPIVDSLEAEGIYRWTVPEKTEGRVDIKVSARDLAGNTGRYESDWLYIKDGRAAVQMAGGALGRDGKRTATAKDGPQDILVADSKIKRDKDGKAISNAAGSDKLVAQPGYSEPDDGSSPKADATTAEAKKEYELATYHRLRGEQDIALQHYQKALKIDSTLIAARNDLGGLLSLMHRYEEAQAEFERVLATEQDNRIALRGLSLVQATRKNYRSARETLEKLLLLEPKDAEAWLYFGDVMLFSGDRIAAREAWRKSAKMENATPEVKQYATRRLAIYSSDRFESGGR